MSQRVECPECEKMLSLPDEAAGKKIKCSGCASVSRIHATDGGTLFLELIDEGEIFQEEPVAPVPRSVRRAPAPASGRRPSPGRGAPSRGRGAAPSSSRGGRAARGPQGATTIFVLGLLGMLLCGLLAPIALFMGLDYSKRCKRARVSPDGLATAGMVLGAVGSILLVIGIIYIAVVGTVVFQQLR